MKAARITISLSSFLFFVASTTATCSAAGLSLLVWLRPDESMIPLFYPLMPGMIAALLITGGHGGTTAEEKIAAVVAAVVNAFTYLLIVVPIRAAWRACFRDENFLAKSKQKDSAP